MPEIHYLTLSNGSNHEYQIKKSKRAKHLRINLTHTGQLSVTVPHRIAVIKAHHFVQSKVTWIEKHLSNIPKQAVDEIPNKLNLMLLDETWSIETVKIESKSTSLHENGQTLVITGNVEDKELVKLLINKWCQKICRELFPEMMASLAEEHGFHFNRLSVRTQKTRWGSCSSKKNISLNSKLLFMPEDVVKYVMIHELCHTIEMNHSSRFWNLVEECDPAYIQHKKELKEYASLIDV